MTVRQEAVEAFAPLRWASEIFDTSEWNIHERTRGDDADDKTDHYPEHTLQAPGAIQYWVEAYKKPDPSSKVPTKCVSLCKFGVALAGFPGICHGGAIMSIMDEALSALMFAMLVERRGGPREDGSWGPLGDVNVWRERLNEGRPIAEILEGQYVTAKLDFKFIAPVPCPGLVGVEVDLLEHTANKMKFRGVMKDSRGIPLLQADGVWVELRPVPKL
ncbi:hypothetical protein BS50DRAFT_576274 [Corynespora cassiicola Philippines]|uniref:Thioesterase domain-containing protein n=1 Tax=Corynespora cassiicola Philippines TaxID=1448308 RepID=A0A2T2NDZ1_CORCC|nr:hypothetical protein BS50DRAFT_576274 [Corynespora cassiicola Philippines]